MITTKKGDQGISHWNNQSIHKDDILIETIGCIDELQAVIGVSQSSLREAKRRSNLDGTDAKIATPSTVLRLAMTQVQEDLWGIMGEISTGIKYEKLEERIELMENEINRMEEELPLINKFLIFKSEKAVKLNWIRTMVRRAERRIVALSKKDSVNPKLMAYINRLSDYLFMLSRREEV